MKNKKKMALVLVSVLSLSTLTLSAFADNLAIDSNSDGSLPETQKEERFDKHGGDMVDEPENAIGQDAAEAKALEDAGVTEDQAGRVLSHLSQLEDGTVVYRVDFIYNDQHYFYQIHATSGEIVENHDEAVTEDRMAGPGGGHGGHGRPDEEQVDEPENAIGKDAAETKALEDAGVTEDQAGRVLSHLSQLEDGTVVYRVDFICNDQHYFYQIHATSGEIVEKNNEAVTEDRMAGPGGGHGRPDEEQAGEPENDAGKDDAETKASDDAAGATADSFTEAASATA